MCSNPNHQKTVLHVSRQPKSVSPDCALRGAAPVGGWLDCCRLNGGGKEEEVGWHQCSKYFCLAASWLAEAAAETASMADEVESTSSLRNGLGHLVQSGRPV